MAAQDWHVLRKVGLHTLNNFAAILSFVGLTYFTKRFITEGWVPGILDDIEKVVLVVLVLIFACQVIYDVVPEKIRAFFTSKFVFA